MKRLLTAILATSCALFARAELAWEKGSYSDDMTPCAHNIASRCTVTPSSDKNMCDGSFASKCDIYPNHEVSWDFPKSRIYSVRIFSRWQDSGRDAISIGSVKVKYSADGEWVDTGAPSVTYDANRTKHYAYLTDSSGEAFATNAVALKVVFGSWQDNGYAGYSEIEIVGDETVDTWPSWKGATFSTGNIFSNPSNEFRFATSTTVPKKLNDGGFSSGVQIASGTNHVWTLAEPADVTSIEFFTAGGGTSHDGINVEKVEYQAEGSSEWTEIVNSCGKYDTNGQSQRLALTALPGHYLAENATAIRIFFGPQDNGYTSYSEIEVRGDRLSTDGSWKCGYFDPASWQSNVSNLLVGVVRSGGTAELNNGTMGKNAGIANDAVTTFTLPLPATVYEVCIYSYHQDAGRDAISIAKLELRQADSDEWIDIDAPPIYYDISRFTHYARFSRNGAKLGENIAGLRVTFGTQENGNASYGEIELLGTLPATAAVFHDLTCTPLAYTADWAVRLSSVGGGEGATVNLWTSTNSRPYELVQSTVLTDSAQLARFSIDYEAFKTINYYVEIVNNDGVRTYYSTNTPASVTLCDNTTYFWKACESGTWQDPNCWTNNYRNGDPRMRYPNTRTCTADLSVLGEGRPVTITLAQYSEAKMTTLPANAVVTWKANNFRLNDFGPCSIRGTNIYDGCDLHYVNGFNTAADSYLKFIGGYSYSHSVNHYGARSIVEVTPGTTLDIGRGGIGNLAKYIIDNTTVSSSSAFVKGGLDAWISNGGIIVLKGAQPKFRDWGGHRMMGAGSNPPFTIRFEFPPHGWTEPVWGFTNTENPSEGGFGGGGGIWRIEVAEPENLSHYGRTLELPLVESLTDTRQIYTNKLDFVVYGESVSVGTELNRYGDRLYYTYGNSDALAPVNPGDLPTGIRFHFGARPIGALIRLK